MLITFITKHVIQVIESCLSRCLKFEFSSYKYNCIKYFVENILPFIRVQPDSNKIMIHVI